MVIRCTAAWNPPLFLARRFGTALARRGIKEAVGCGAGLSNAPARGARPAAFQAAPIRPCGRGFLFASRPERFPGLSEIRPELLLERELLAEADQRLELVAGGARVDRLRGARDAVLQVAGLAAGDQRGRSIHEHDVTLGPELAVQQGADELGVLLAVAAEQGADGRSRQAGVVGTQGEPAHGGRPGLAR